MKIRTGKYIDQFAIGITWLRYPSVSWSVIFDLGLWYVEISRESDKEDDSSSLFPTTLVCYRCGSPKNIFSHFNEKLEFELVCAECLRYEEYMKSLTDEEPEANT